MFTGHVGMVTGVTSRVSALTCVPQIHHNNTTIQHGSGSLQAWIHTMIQGTSCFPTATKKLHKDLTQQRAMILTQKNE